VHESVEMLLAALGVAEAPVLLAFPAAAQSLDEGVKHEVGAVYKLNPVHPTL
jgi:hypothetical protein